MFSHKQRLHKDIFGRQTETGGKHVLRPLEIYIFHVCFFKYNYEIHIASLNLASGKILFGSEINNCSYIFINTPLGKIV